MTLVGTAEVFAALHATWPAATETVVDGWIIRDGAGAGKRASAASLVDDGAGIAVAEQAQLGMGQAPLFMIQDTENSEPLDRELAARGYSVVDPTLIYACDIDLVAPRTLPTAMCYAIWDPVHVMHEIWHAGGVGPARIDLMHRVAGAKTGILARSGDTACGTAFVGVHEGIAMVHAVEVLEQHRRQGVAKLVMAQAAHWGRANGAKTLALAVTRANLGANALYADLGMTQVGAYHYRKKDTP